MRDCFVLSMSDGVKLIIINLPQLKSISQMPHLRCKFYARSSLITYYHNLIWLLSWKPNPSFFQCFNHSPVDEYGFHRPDDFDYSSYEEFMSSYIRVLARRASRWDRFLRGVNKVRKSRRGKKNIVWKTTIYLFIIFLILKSSSLKYKSNKNKEIQIEKQLT